MFKSSMFPCSSKLADVTTYKEYRNSWALDARAGRWTLDAGLWTLDTGLWTLDPGRWTLDAGLWTLDSGRWTLNAGLWTLDSGRWTLDARPWTLDSGRWTLDSGRWTLDAGLWTLDSGPWTLHLESQALYTKHSCRLVQNKIRTQFLVLLILQRVQVLTLNIKCYVIKEYRNKFLL